MTAKGVLSPPPAYRVFISSTYEDMKEYRNAASEALTNIQAVPMGMERFTAATQPVLDRCYEELQQCQFCLCILGFRYGSLYKDTAFSYPELEFREAERLGIPVLAFIRDGTIDLNKIDLDDFARLTRYKKKLQNSEGNRLTAYFTTPDDLRDKITRALQAEFKQHSRPSQPRSDVDTKKISEKDYLGGTKICKNILIVLGEFCGQTVRLRVRSEGSYGPKGIKRNSCKAFRRSRPKKHTKFKYVTKSRKKSRQVLKGCFDSENSTINLSKFTRESIV